MTVCFEIHLTVTPALSVFGVSRALWLLGDIPHGQIDPRWHSRWGTGIQSF